MELLDDVELRVLGALLEKEATTPEYYPLTLNALVNACNQKSNRDPVSEYDEAAVLDALTRLRENKLAVTITGNGRVNKYAQRISETLNLGRRELAVLCVLLLRGPQTLAEIKDRSDRMYSFSEMDEAERVLQKLNQFDPPLVRKLERQPGQKESRYAQLLGGEPSLEAPAESGAGKPSRMSELEAEVQRLSSELADLKRRFEDLEMQLR